MTQWGLPATSVFLHFSLFINGNPATHPISHLGAEACCYLFLTFLKKVILWIYILLSIDSISFQDCISPFVFTLFICMQLKPAQI